MTSPITKRIQEANGRGEIALIPFLPAGFPDRDRFWKELEVLDRAGASVIEIGMPFSDPVADGPTVEAASLHSLELGVDLDYILDGLAERKGTFNAALLLMGYLNPVMQYGFERFAKRCGEAGVSGLIIADMPIDEACCIKDALDTHGVSLIPLVGLNTEAERMGLYADGGDGFCYVVSVMGITGQRDTLPPEVKEKLRQAQDVFDIPVALGFGIQRPEQLEELKGLADAAVFGSALINHINDGGSAESFMQRWK
ncbi:tryptophan synthase subunit alpha [Salidesulfovibrio brasiliensis]